MVITYYNFEFFKLQLGDTTVVFNPVSKNSKFKTFRFGADIVLVSTNHENFNGYDNIISKNKSPFIITGPGEYEIQNIFIKGSLSYTQYEGKERINTIYSLVLDGIKIGFLGALDSIELSDESKLLISDADVLFVPIGGNGVLNASDAHKLVTKSGAKIIIPMYYGKESLDKFLKESGLENVKAVEKLTLKKKDLLDKSGEVVVLSPVS